MPTALPPTVSPRAAPRIARFIAALDGRADPPPDLALPGLSAAVDGVAAFSPIGRAAAQARAASRAKAAVSRATAADPGLPVECLEHPEWGALSTAEMHRRTGVIPSELAKCVAEGRTRNRQRFVRAGEAFVPYRANRKGCKAVELPDENLTLPTIAAAARYIGCSRANVIAAMAEGWLCYGHWVRRPGSGGPRPTPRRTVPVEDVATGRRFASKYQAAQFLLGGLRYAMRDLWRVQEAVSRSASRGRPVRVTLVDGAGMASVHFRAAREPEACTAPLVNVSVFAA